MKNILEGSSAYLAGPIEHADDAVSWRDEITPFLRDMGIRVYNPLVKPIWVPCLCVNTKYDHELLKQKILEKDKDALRINKSIRLASRRLAATADFIICYMPKAITYGTFEELSIGSTDGKPVLFLCPDEDFPPSSWLLEQFVGDKEEWSDIFFKNIDNLCIYLSRVDKHRRYDPYKWIFLDWPMAEE